MKLISFGINYYIYYDMKDDKILLVFDNSFIFNVSRLYSQL